MWRELNLYDPTKSETEIITDVFKAPTNINCVFVAPYYAGKLKALLPSSIKISCPVDYPMGLSDFKLREHACISAIRKGADFVDLVVNPVYITNGQKSSLVSDIKTNKKICDDHNIQLRIILDYRIFPDSLIYYVSRIIYEMGIYCISPSTGQFVEDSTDNLITCQMIANKNPSLNTILNALSLTKEELLKIENAKIYGIRLKKFSFI